MDASLCFSREACIASGAEGLPETSSTNESPNRWTDGPRCSMRTGIFSRGLNAQAGSVCSGSVCFFSGLT